MKSYLLLGRNGDICSVLPMLKREADSGEKPRLVVNKDYAPLLEGVSYVDPLVVNHDITGLEAAYQYAQATCGKVTSLHLIGPEPDQKTRMTSFVKEMWRRGGWRDLWDDQEPLVFDRRSKEREAKLVEEHMPKKKGRWDKKTILVSAEGISSPFPYKELLYGLLDLSLSKQFHILTLPRAERLYDLLALYERAWCLICTDSAPLHLAGAVPTLPVLAITNDKPMLWNGSPWRPNHVWYCRYSDFPNRSLEIPQVVEDAHKQSFKIHQGMCGRYYDGFPYLKDCVRMALQKTNGGGLALSGGTFAFINDTTPAYAYRTRGGTYQPVVDWFSGTKDFWRKVLPELPDLVMAKDYYHRHALWAAFKKHGAVDVT